MIFTDLTVLVAAGLIGPLLASGKVPLVPAVVGELAAGIALGRTGFDVLDPSGQPYPFLHDVGFALLMFGAGTHFVFHRGQLPRTAMALAIAIALAVPAAFVIDSVLQLGRVPLLIVLLGGSSAAVLFPMLEERQLRGPNLAFVTAWVAAADSVTLVALPLALSTGHNLAPILLGDLAIVGLGVTVFLLGARLAGRRTARLLRKRSRQRGWALQLRWAILLLFGLAAIAEHTHGSSLIAGFGAGVVLAQLREPKRLARQLSGLADGFFVPAFFVLLGATLDLRGLATDPRALGFGVLLAGCAVSVHVLAAVLSAPSQRIASGLAASAQLGLPAAAAALGLANGVLSETVAAAIVGAGVLTLVPAAVGVALLARHGPDDVPRKGPQVAPSAPTL